jgi:hypothetical protein
LWGSEYGGLVQEFLQSIVRHRWDQKYLLEQFDDDEFDDLQVRRALLRPYSRPLGLLACTRPLDGSSQTLSFPSSGPTNGTYIALSSDNLGVRQRTPPWQVSPELLDAYQKSFMELDLACRGFLEIDALKVSPCDAFI